MQQSQGQAGPRNLCFFPCFGRSNERKILLLSPLLASGKAGLLSKRSAKKSDPGKNDGASHDVPGSPEDLERNQKIMQWIIEGEKEISRHRKTTHG